MGSLGGLGQGWEGPAWLVWVDHGILGLEKLCPILVPQPDIPWTHQEPQEEGLGMALGRGNTPAAPGALGNEILTLNPHTEPKSRDFGPGTAPTTPL